VSRHAIVNIVLGIVAATLVATLVYLRVDDTGEPAATTTIATTTTLPPTTLAPTTTAASTTEAPTTAPPTTLPPTTLPPTTLPPADRGFVAVVVTSAGLNGARVGPGVFFLSQGGWTNIRGVNGVVQIPLTTIFYADGFQNSAELMATDMGLPITQTAPLASAPPVAGLGDAVLVVYLGDA
jgi:hypothetical protein